MKTCRSCCKIDCVCRGLVNDEAKSSQNMEPESFVKTDGSPLDRPDDTPWSFTILFVVTDNGDKTDPDLNLKREFERIEQAYREARVSKRWIQSRAYQVAALLEMERGDD